ncbi:MAG: hypothetical protein CO002_01880 [Candidatus Portnoybacteria bacterium CG_4_8_14_3_um_filter_44_10]|uniref:Uncharacterized protein n=1 Tax=Candidatus Portnoybacteria bacterium CG_4_8_14_3_um_filter_44_10 TaxID=1974802 RepID=A0A2M7IG36_9BACT|nr:MAG: hypothetical protein CO002_01880 [Candidatus Portnoybacteria bacterium CG_4_8_14_3_um_filter_44_10]
MDGNGLNGVNEPFERLRRAANYPNGSYLACLGVDNPILCQSKKPLQNKAICYSNILKNLRITTDKEISGQFV